MLFSSFVGCDLFQESVGGLPDKGLDISSVEEGEFLCLLLMVWRSVLLFLWVRCRFMWVQQGVEGSGVSLGCILLSISCSAWLFFLV